MQYTVKPGDTLSKIANRLKVPVASLIKLNSQLANPDLLMVGQVIYVPNMEDVPAGANFDTPVKVEQLVLRARSVVNCNIRYKLGSGGTHPEESSPSRDSLCDCSGFVCWVLGLSRQTNIPFYKHFGGWIFTDSIEADINSASGIFERLSRPEPGCIVVYGAGSKIGHVGVVPKCQEIP
ncbi:LysM peptidoglycan-binding domain-containing protein [Arcticibacter sp. MXS-1]|uniref:LysM peptidoglycan-binding domain-containing protein n=1 Tax=Arcticibacter sp. MXS-1 TaxID=3341726 RepID=UPI0035A8E055